MSGQGRKVNDQFDTQRRAPDDKGSSDYESPRDVMERVSDDVVKRINELFEKKVPKTK